MQGLVDTLGSIPLALSPPPYLAGVIAVGPWVMFFAEIAEHSTLREAGPTCSGQVAAPLAIAGARHRVRDSDTPTAYAAWAATLGHPTNSTQTDGVDTSERRRAVPVGKPKRFTLSSGPCVDACCREVAGFSQ